MKKENIEPLASLWDIERNVEILCQHLKGIAELADYADDTKTRDAVERRIMNIGEAVSNVRDKLHDKTVLETRIPEIKQVIQVRNALVHRYKNLRHGIVWDFVQKTLPGLRINALALAKAHYSCAVNLNTLYHLPVQ